MKTQWISVKTPIKLSANIRFYERNKIFVGILFQYQIIEKKV